MVKIMRLLILLVFVFIATSYAVPNPTLFGTKGLSGLLKGKSDCEKPKEPEQCDSGDGRGGDSQATAVAISSATSHGGKGKAFAKSVAVADSGSSNKDDNCD